MIRSEKYWLDVLDNLGLSEVNLRQISVDELFINLKNRVDLNIVYKAFQEFLTYAVSKNVSKLFQSGFRRSDMHKMRKGIFPSNISVCLKVPIEYGGTLDFENLYIIKTNHFMNVLNKFLLMQIVDFQEQFNTKDLPLTIFCIAPEGEIFIPIANQSVDGGGHSDKSEEHEAAILAMAHSISKSAAEM